jgi:hypothetical protein
LWPSCATFLAYFFLKRKGTGWVESGGGGGGGCGGGGGGGGGGAPTGGGGGGGNGTLQINSTPWSQVIVDGRVIGNTPQMSIQLPAGSHRVELVNDQFNVRETLTVQITPGETTRRIVRLQIPTGG